MSTRRKTSTRQNLGRPRESILEAATHLFSEHGFAGTTMRDIAKAVGVLPGSLYAHIDGKETLLFEIVDTGIDKFLAVAEPLAAGPPPADERLRAAIKAHVGVVGDNPERTLVVFHQWRFLSDENLALAVAKRARYEDVFAKIVDDGVRTGVFSAALDARIVVLSLLGSLNWTAEWYSPDGPDTPDELGDKLADAQLRGLLHS